jgi:hypothetical protein
MMRTLLGEGLWGKGFDSIAAFRGSLEGRMPFSRSGWTPLPSGEVKETVW